MKFPKIDQHIKHARDAVNSNSPVILTGLALAGLGATVYLTAKGAFKAKTAIDTLEGERHVGQPDLTKQEKFLATYKFYAPAAVTTIATGTCMIMATKIGLNRTAALAGAAVILERNNEEYKAKVKEILGDNKHVKVSDAVASDQVAKMNPLPLPREGEQTFVDAWTSRPFSTTMARMESAVNDFNKDMLYNGYATLNEFYHRIGLEDIQMGDQIGWSIGDGRDGFLELVYTTTLKDDRAVVSFKFDREPMPTFRDADI